MQRWLKFVKYFREFDVEPVVVTVDPNKASYQVRDESLAGDVPLDIEIHHTDTFEPFELYKKVLGKKGIPHAGFANEGNPGLLEKASRFVRGNLFIPDARKGWNKYALEKCEALLEQDGFDAFITTSPPHSTQLIGQELKKRFNIPWIADMRDPWTDIYYYDQFNHTKFAKERDAKYEREVLETADKVVVVSDAIKRMFASKSDDVEESKIHVIPNGYDEEDISIVELETNEEFVLTYVGTLSEKYNVSGLIGALKALQVEQNIRLRFVGNIPDSIIDRVRSEGLGDVLDVVGYVDHSKALDYLRCSAALLLIIPDVPDNEGILTGKLFEYLGSKKPILCIGPPEGDAAHIIRECEAGSVFDYQDAEGIRDTLHSWIGRKKKGQQLRNESTTYEKYSRRQLSKEFIALLK